MENRSDLPFNLIFWAFGPGHKISCRPNAYRVKNRDRRLGLLCCLSEGDFQPDSLIHTMLNMAPVFWILSLMDGDGDDDSIWGR